MNAAEQTETWLQQALARTATPKSDPPLRVLHEDGTLHFTDLKRLALSGVQYLHAVNCRTEPTDEMLIGTVVHQLLLGSRRNAKPIVKYTGGIRRGAAWDRFLADHSKGQWEIVTETIWNTGEAIAEALVRSPIARARLAVSQFEVPLAWEEAGIPCSTSGIDLIASGHDVGDVKTCPTTEPETFKRHGLKMLYPMQLAFYARGCRAHGIEVRDLFVLGIERRAPFEVVELILDDDLILFAEKTLTLWLEELRRNILSIPEPRSVLDWPGFAQAAMRWAAPSWLVDDEAEAS